MYRRIVWTSKPRRTNGNKSGMRKMERESRTIWLVSMSATRRRTKHQIHKSNVRWHEEDASIERKVTGFMNPLFCSFYIRYAVWQCLASIGRTDDSYCNRARVKQILCHCVSRERVVKWRTKNWALVFTLSVKNAEQEKDFMLKHKEEFSLSAA